MASRSIKVQHSYDAAADVLYVRFGNDQEPTFIENVDDLLLLEVGWFTGLPKGFRLLGPKCHGIKAINTALLVKRLKKQVHQLMAQHRKTIENQEPVFADLCEQLPSVLTSASL